jgi:phosphinothricin acetyltransferase
MAGVRTASEDDAAAIAAIYAPYVIQTAVSFEEIAPSPDEMAARIRATLKAYPYLVFEDDNGQVLAYAYASRHAARAAYRWSVDVAIYAAPTVHRQGVGRALYARLFDILARQGYHSAYAAIALPNEQSVGLHAATGFVEVGRFPAIGFKLGAWRDLAWWRRPLKMGPPQGEPIAFGELPRGPLD